jgi:hypothetical protein
MSLDHTSEQLDWGESVILSTALADKFIDIVRGYNDVVLDMGSIALEKGVEYQLYFAATNHFYPPSVQPSWVAANDCIDIAQGSAYYGDDRKLIFSGTVGLTVPVEAGWTINDYLTIADATRWIDNVKSIRSKCSGKSSTPETPEALSYHFAVVIRIAQSALHASSPFLLLFFCPCAGSCLCGQFFYPVNISLRSVCNPRCHISPLKKSVCRQRQ